MEVVKNETPEQVLVRRLSNMTTAGARGHLAEILEVARAAARLDLAAKAHGAWFMDDEAPLGMGGPLEEELSAAERHLSDTLDDLRVRLGIL